MCIVSFVYAASTTLGCLFFDRSDEKGSHESIRVLQRSRRDNDEKPNSERPFLPLLRLGNADIRRRLEKTRSLIDIGKLSQFPLYTLWHDETPKTRWPDECASEGIYGCFFGRPLATYRVLLITLLSLQILEVLFGAATDSFHHRHRCILQQLSMDASGKFTFFYFSLCGMIRHQEHDCPP